MQNTQSPSNEQVQKPNTELDDLRETISLARKTGYTKIAVDIDLLERLLEHRQHLA